MVFTTVLGYYHSSNIVLEESIMQVNFGLATVKEVDCEIVVGEFEPR